MDHPRFTERLLNPTLPIGGYGIGPRRRHFVIGAGVVKTPVSLCQKAGELDDATTSPAGGVTCVDCGDVMREEMRRARKPYVHASGIEDPLSVAPAQRVTLCGLASVKAQHPDDRVCVDTTRLDVVDCPVCRGVLDRNHNQETIMGTTTEATATPEGESTDIASELHYLRGQVVELRDKLTSHERVHQRLIAFFGPIEEMGGTRVASEFFVDRALERHAAALQAQMGGHISLRQHVDGIAAEDLLTWVAAQVAEARRREKEPTRTEALIYALTGARRSR